MRLLAKLMGAYYALDTKYWVWLAEQAHKRGGDCRSAMITNYENPRDEEGFADYVATTARLYRKFLPEGWEVAYSTTRDAFMSSAFKPRAVYYYTLVFYDPKRCKDPTRAVRG